MLSTLLFIIVWNFKVKLKWLHENGDKRIVGNILCITHLLVTWIYWELEVTSMKHVHIQKDNNGAIR